MKPAFVFALLALPALALATPAGAADSALVLRQGDIFTDAVGSVIGVAVTNNSAATLGSAVVTCAFTAKGKPIGSASTAIYNIVPGSKGEDQVHLIGATADAATCSITGTTPPAAN
ncbi:hypothetical protein [Ancylobacter amanitiformis]|uniref:Uncharacterized protein n=1 Tax=Ancylobacter amanitiformis TaxID=217069 RepID=A0ABU0LTP8_9HYPH|nr:hypothetical protein [Ancylobacter amanitiformis]MDQ0512071.1 hypothetical protein [Ancylobacter amanitiformis]